MRSSQLFDAQRFMPHGMCYLWQPDLLWTHVVADLLIGVSYVAISLGLGWLVWLAARDRVDEAGPFSRLPFWWMFLAFGLFIVACGVTHFLGAWTVWNPDYWLAGGAKVVTALASVATAVALPPLVPRAVTLVREARASELRRRQLEVAHAELQDANERIRELDELKTRFFANVSHELRTPLTLVTVPVRRRLEDPSLSPEIRRELEGVLRNARTLEDHVDDILDVTRLASREMTIEAEEVDLAALVRSTAASFDALADERELTFRIDAPGPVPAVVDEDKVERVLVNLISNAFKFTPVGGAVRVRLEPDEAAEGVRITVADSGPGIPEHLRDAVFDRFRQVEGGDARTFGGTGLGLTIVREFTELHGGSVRIGESPEGGAEVTVVLPALAPDDGDGHSRPHDGPDRGARAVDRLRSGFEAHSWTAPTVDPRVSREPRAAGATAPTVLVVEDNEEMGRLLVDLLPAGYRGILARNGEEGLRLAEEAAVDVIVSDVMMPRMGGEELLRAVRARPSLTNIPFIVLSARAEEERRLELLETGAQDFIIKPFAPAEVAIRIGNWVAVSRTRRLLQDELALHEAGLEGLATELAHRKRELEQAFADAERAREEEARASRAKSDFLAVVSHELRTPLTAIIGYTGLLLEGIPGPLEPEQRFQLDRIRASSKHLRELIDQILEYAKLQRDDVTPRRVGVRLEDLLEEVETIAGPMAATEGVALRVEHAPDDASLHTDRSLVVRILLNLVTNGIKYTDEGEVRLTAESGPDGVLFRVADTGIGIAPEHREKIFEPFWQVDQSSTRTATGTGLGLSISRRLARLLGGDITVHDRAGGGSVFELALPPGAGDAGGPAPRRAAQTDEA